jgi:hypothetical protein
MWGAHPSPFQDPSIGQSLLSLAVLVSVSVPGPSQTAQACLACAQGVGIGGKDKAPFVGEPIERDYPHFVIDR